MKAQTRVKTMWGNNSGTILVVNGNKAKVILDHFRSEHPDARIQEAENLNRAAWYWLVELETELEEPVFEEWTDGRDFDEPSATEQRTEHKDNPIPRADVHPSAPNPNKGRIHECLFSTQVKSQTNLPAKFPETLTAGGSLTTRILSELLGRSTLSRHSTHQRRALSAIRFATMCCLQ